MTAISNFHKECKHFFPILNNYKKNEISKIAIKNKISDEITYSGPE